MGEEVYKIPEEAGEELEGYFGKRQYPYVKREGEDEFVVMVHSKPFGKDPLSEEEKEEREDAKKKKVQASRKKRLELAERKAEEAKQRVKELKEED